MTPAGQPRGKQLPRGRKVNHLGLLVSTDDGLLLLLFYNKKAETKEKDCMKDKAGNHSVAPEWVI